MDKMDVVADVVLDRVNIRMYILLPGVPALPGPGDASRPVLDAPGPADVGVGHVEVVLHHLTAPVDHVVVRADVAAEVIAAAAAANGVVVPVVVVIVVVAASASAVVVVVVERLFAHRLERVAGVYLDVASPVAPVVAGLGPQGDAVLRRPVRLPRRHVPGGVGGAPPVRHPAPGAAVAAAAPLIEAAAALGVGVVIVPVTLCRERFIGGRRAALISIQHPLIILLAEISGKNSNLLSI